MSEETENNGGRPKRETVKFNKHIEPTSPIVIPAEQEKVIPATTEKVLTKYWLRRLNINSPSPTQPTLMFATLVPYDESTGELYEDKKVQLVLNDIVGMAADDSQLATTIETIFSEIERQCKLKGLI